MLTKPKHEEINKNNYYIIKYHQLLFLCVARIHKESL